MSDSLEGSFLERIKHRLLKCTRCSYVWVQKNKNKKPKNCPLCNSPYWRVPKKLRLTIEMVKGIKF